MGVDGFSLWFKIHIRNCVNASPGFCSLSNCTFYDFNAILIITKHNTKILTFAFRSGNNVKVLFSTNILERKYLITFVKSVSFNKIVYKVQAMFCINRFVKSGTGWLTSPWFPFRSWSNQLSFAYRPRYFWRMPCSPFWWACPSEKQSSPLSKTKFYPSAKQSFTPQQNKVLPLCKTKFYPSAKQSFTPQQNKVLPLSKTKFYPSAKQSFTPQQNKVLPLRKPKFYPSAKQSFTTLQNKVLPLSKTKFYPSAKQSFTPQQNKVLPLCSATTLINIHKQREVNKSHLVAQHKGVRANPSIGWNDVRG